MTGSTVAAAVLAGVAVVVAGDGRRVARSRMRRLSSPGPIRREPMRDGTAPSAGGPARPWVGRGAAGILVTVVLLAAVGSLRWGPVSASLGLVMVLVASRPLAARAHVRRRDREIAAALPRFADLVAACLEAGAAPADAIDVVRRHVGGPVSARLAPVAGALRSGVDPLTVYDGNQPHDPVRGLVIALARAMETGAPPADMVAAVADDQRRRRRWSGEAAARRAGVYAVGPLVLCFLPAFVLLGVVPVVVGIAAEVLGELS